MRRMTPSESLRILRQGSPVEAMEATKFLIGSGEKQLLARQLVPIALNRDYRKWNRIASIHTLGFLGSRSAVPALVSILADEQEEPHIREHAAEAIGHIRGKRAIPILGKILNSNERPSIRAECIFALSKMWEFRGDDKSLHPGARAILHKCARTKPTGKVAKQLKEALNNIRRGVT